MNPLHKKMRANFSPHGVRGTCSPSTILCGTIRDTPSAVGRTLDWGAVLLRRLPPETAHRATLTLARLAAPLIAPAPADDPRLAVSAPGPRFTNPIGLAA